MNNTSADSAPIAGTAAPVSPTAHGIKRTGLAHVSGQHLSDAANEPGDLTAADLAAIDEEFAPMTEAQYLEADRARNVDKADRAASREFEEAMRLQMRKNGINDVIGGR
jgi:hypothetical protein